MPHDVKYASYAVTVRPRDGVTDDHLCLLTKLYERSSTFHHSITEKEGTATHNHAAVYLKESSTLSNFRRKVAACLPDDLRTKHAVKVKIMYNDDWLAQYLDKDDHTQLISTLLPTDRTELHAWYPAKDDTRAKKPVSAEFLKWEAMYIADGLPIPPTIRSSACNYDSVQHFFANHTYTVRDIAIIPHDVHDRKWDQRSIQLRRFLNRHHEWHSCPGLEDCLSRHK